MANAMIEAPRKVIERMHYPLEAMPVCVRWYAAYPLSLRHVEKIMAERGLFVDHATVHRWVTKIPLVLAAARSLSHSTARRFQSARPVGAH